MKIKNITAREIFDSRGNPTVECEMIFENIPYPFRGMVQIMEQTLFYL